MASLGSPDSSAQVSSAVSKLSLKPASAGSNKATKCSPTKTKAPVADSWEDEDVSSNSTESDESRPSSSSGQEAATKGPDIDAGTLAPLPTPISPAYNNATSWPFSPTAATYPLSAPGPGQLDGPSSEPTKRPEKTDAVARRMIASALGMRVPKLSEEQKAYEKAMKERERKRREEERDKEKKREAEAEEARKSVWED